MVATGDLMVNGTSYMGDAFITEWVDTIEAVKKLGVEPSTAQAMAMLPKNTIKLEGKTAQQMLKLMEILDEHDDVQKVHANFDISDEVMEKVAAATG